MPRGPDFFQEMTAPQIEALEEFARHPGKTIDDVHKYLADIQVRTSRSSVHRWLQDFRLWDKTQRAADVAKSYMQAASGSDPTAVTEASLRKFNELVFEALTSGDELDSLDLRRIAGALKTGLDAQHAVNTLRKQQAEAIRSAEAAAKSGASATDVVKTIKDALGIAA